MGSRWSSTLGRVLAGVRVGVPARWVTPGLADEVLAEAGQDAAGQRFRALRDLYWASHQDPRYSTPVRY